MSRDVGVSIETLDGIHSTLASDVAALLDLAEQMLAEMEAIDDLRTATAMTSNGARLLTAREVRREAMRSRKRAIEAVQRAHEIHQRARDLAKRLDSVTFRARTLLDEKHR